jgi:gas vesicle protein
MGYLRGLTHGAIAGAVLGLLYAPDAGVTMRRRLSRLLGQAEEMLAAQTQATAPAAPTAPRRGAGNSEGRARRP